MPVATIPAPGVLAQPAAAIPTTPGSLPSLNDLLSQWEQMHKQRVLELEAKTNQQQVDLGKWQNWYQWASGEITTARAQNDALIRRAEDAEARAVEAVRRAEGDAAGPARGEGVAAGRRDDGPASTRPDERSRLCNKWMDESAQEEKRRQTTTHTGGGAASKAAGSRRQPWLMHSST